MLDPRAVGPGLLGAHGRNEPDGSPGIISPPKKDAGQKSAIMKSRVAGPEALGCPGEAAPHRMMEEPRGVSAAGDGGRFCAVCSVW